MSDYGLLIANCYTYRIMGKKISDRLRELIEEQIATGEMAPGTPLDEAALMARFEASRTPVREALIQLEAGGLIEMRPRRGAAVTTVTPIRLVEMFQVMAELEAMSARLAARRMDRTEQQALLAAHEACRAACEADDPDEYFYANERFHQMIYAGSHNGFLQEQALALQRRLRPYRRLQLRVRGRVATSYLEHEGVVAAIVEGSPEAACQRIRDHVTVQGERFSDLLATLQKAAERADERVCPPRQADLTSC